MINGKKIIAIIPARGGSKGIPGKNIKQICGKPLIAWTIKQALSSRYIDEVFVSTDSKKIATVSKKYGAGVPFLRPAKYALDSSPTSDAVIHTLDTFEAMGKKFDYLMVLEPTSPLRKRNDIDSSIKLIATGKKADCLISVGQVHTEHPMIIKKIFTLL